MAFYGPATAMAEQKRPRSPGTHTPGLLFLSGFFHSTVSARRFPPERLEKRFLADLIFVGWQRFLEGNFSLTPMPFSYQLRKPRQLLIRGKMPQRVSPRRRPQVELATRVSSNLVDLQARRQATITQSPRLGFTVYFRSMRAAVNCFSVKGPTTTLALRSGLRMPNSAR
jgi:hypothetical protein